jgi:hypothetical protein
MFNIFLLLQDGKTRMLIFLSAFFIFLGLGGKRGVLRLLSLAEECLDDYGQQQIKAENQLYL